MSLARGPILALALAAAIVAPLAPAKAHAQIPQIAECVFGRNGSEAGAAPANAKPAESPWSAVPAVPRELQPKVTGGAPTQWGWFNETVAIFNESRVCTGVMLSGRAILTAGHCVCDLALAAKPAIIRFGAAIGGKPGLFPARTDPSLTRLLDPAFCAALETSRSGASPYPAGRDLALIFLDAETIKPPETGGEPLLAILVGHRPLLPIVPDSTIVPALVATPDLLLSTSLTKLLVVGFGLDDAGRVGVKSHACVPIRSRICGGANLQAQFGCAGGRETVLADPGARRDTCGGDSGGPVFAIVKAGAVTAYYLAAITSRAAVGADCGSGGIYTLITPAVVGWLRSNGVAVGSYPYPEQ